LNEWKTLLGWEDLSWTGKNDESGDQTIVFNAASGERLLAGKNSPLESLEHLLNIVRSHGDRSVPRVFLEVEGHAVSTDKKILDEAKRAVEEVKQTGEPFRMEPMPSRDRRLVHQALANHPDVETASEGEGPWRKVVVKPKNRGLK
jgi:spoIIIJ-associated protein